VYSEEAIIEGCKRKKPVYQEALYQRYARKMMGVCSRYGRTQFESEDIFQEAFVKVFQYIHTYQGGSFEAWLKRIFVNTAINHYHKNKKHYNQLEYEEAPDTILEHEDILSSLTTAELLEAINQLPEGNRLIFNLFVLEGYTHKEIGDMLGIHEGTSKSQLARAKASLKKILVTLYPSLYADR
jgi:RNA polymerase sigma factor (sigma-70 family)